MSDPPGNFERVSKRTGHIGEPVFEYMCADSGRYDPWRPAAGRAERGEALRPAESP